VGRKRERRRRRKGRIIEKKKRKVKYSVKITGMCLTSEHGKLVIEKGREGQIMA
jgi:hypothetical protein